MTNINNDYKSQANFRKQCLWFVAIATVCLIGILILQWKNHTEQEIQALRKEVQVQSKTLEAIHSSLETLNASVLQTKKDTILVKEVD